MPSPSDPPMNFPRVGLGIDSHRIAAGGPMRIGGVDIPCDWHLQGHSDADVLLHAITDAVLGAASLPDIGQLFPDTDPQYAGADSAKLLAEAIRRVREAGYALINVDCVLRIERPKISPHKDAIRRRVAEILGVELDRVGVKAKTGERTGDIGEGRLAEAHCVALLIPIRKQEE
jgi:2-C-methyl-D-erythritol 2,4-cyclodiphosphate synthase